MIIGISGKANSGKDAVAQMIRGIQVAKENGKEPTLEYINRNCYDSKWKIKRFADTLKDITCMLIGCTKEQLEDREFKESPLGENWWYYNVRDNINQSYIKKPYLSSDEDMLHYNWTEVKLIKLSPRKLMQLLGTEAGREVLHPNIWCNSLFSTIDRKLIESEEKRLLSIWKNINTRCTNPNYAKYDKYGGKGIENKWSDFETFKNWAKNSGYTNELTLDRKDRDKNYVPDNCRWVTPALQAFNQGVYKNSQSEVKGVSLKSERVDKYPDPWVAQIQYNGKKEHIGYFNSKEEASIAYKKRYEEVEEILWKESLQEKYSYSKVIIPDVRFENEAKAIRDRGGILIRVNRPLERMESGMLKVKHKSITRHPSETALDNWKDWDYIIENDGNLEDLLEKVKLIYNEII